MLHFVHHAALQSDEIPGQNEPNHLTVAVFQCLVPKTHALKGCVKMRGGRALGQKFGAGLGNKLAGLELRHELNFIICHVFEQFELTKRTVFAIRFHDASLCHSLMRKIWCGVMRG